MLSRTLTLAAAMLAAATFCAPAQAAFVGAIDPAAWTLSNTNAGNGTASFSADASTLTLTGADFTGSPLATFDPVTTAETLGTAGLRGLSFSWAYHTDDSNGSGEDVFGYVLGGLWTQLSTDGLYADQSGSVTLALTGAASDFSFQVRSADAWGGAATVAISNVQAVPEPASLALTLGALGLAGLGLRRRARQP